MLYDGSVCIANPDGTELSLFSDKPRRPCLLVYHDEHQGYVFPISTARPKRADFRVGEGWVIIDRVYCVPLSQLSGTGTTAAFWDDAKFHRVVREKLVQREQDFLKSESLRQRPFARLPRIAAPEPVEPAPEEPPPPPPKSDEFEAYMKFDVDRDMRRHDLKDK
ncbi:MAG: hypothetical protein JNJ45_07195 [Chthonomonas sp.]|nr:hypothetical protein [Chthonomonas sp.]